MKSNRNQEKKEENKDLTLSAKIPVKTEVFPRKYQRRKSPVDGVPNNRQQSYELRAFIHSPQMANVCSGHTQNVLDTVGSKDS